MGCTSEQTEWHYSQKQTPVQPSARPLPQEQPRHLAVSKPMSINLWMAGGNDNLAGGGNDLLQSGLGTACFAFAEAGPANFDMVADYSHSEDKIALADFLFSPGRRTIFGSLLSLAANPGLTTNILYLQPVRG